MFKLHFIPFETITKIRARAEHLSMSSDDNAPHSVVDIEQVKRSFQLVRHRVREGIVFLRAVEGQ